MDQKATLTSDLRASFPVAWSAPFVLILISHALVDTYSNIVPASLGVIRKAWGLTDVQAAWLLGVGSLSSGLAQPIFAWVSDRSNSRLYGGLGLCTAALFISCLGIAHSPTMLFMFYIAGMIGVGMFHPIGASTIGQLSQQNRSKSISAFFVAGMVGGITGAFVGPRILTMPGGFTWLPLIMIPGLLVAVLLNAKISRLAHRTSQAEKHFSESRLPAQWTAIAMLYIASALRFSVNMALVYLYVRWMESNVSAAMPSLSKQEITDVAAPWVGNLNASTIAGMAVGGLTAGFIIPAGREKWPLVFVPMVFAPCIGLIPFANQWLACLLAFGAGIAFACMVPVTLALAQRLVPHRSSLVSGLMLGGAWAIAMVGPRLAEWSIQRQGIDQTFFATAFVLIVSGLIILPIRNQTIRATGESSGP